MRTLLLSFMMVVVTLSAQAAVVGDVSTNRGRQEEIMTELKNLKKEMQSLKKSVQKSVMQMSNTLNAMSAQVSLIQQSALMSQSAQLNELKLMVQEMTAGGDTGKSISQQLEAETRRLEKSLEEFKAQAMVKDVLTETEEAEPAAPVEVKTEEQKVTVPVEEQAAPPVAQ